MSLVLNSKKSIEYLLEYDRYKLQHKAMNTRWHTLLKLLSDHMQPLEEVFSRAGLDTDCIYTPPAHRHEVFAIAHILFDKSKKRLPQKVDSLLKGAAFPAMDIHSADDLLYRFLLYHLPPEDDLLRIYKNSWEIRIKPLFHDFKRPKDISRSAEEDRQFIVEMDRCKNLAQLQDTMRRNKSIFRCRNMATAGFVSDWNGDVLTSISEIIKENSASGTAFTAHKGMISAFTQSRTYATHRGLHLPRPSRAQLICYGIRLQMPAFVIEDLLTLSGFEYYDMLDPVEIFVKEQLETLYRESPYIFGTGSESEQIIRKYDVATTGQTDTDYGTSISKIIKARISAGPLADPVAPWAASLAEYQKYL